MTRTVTDVLTIMRRAIGRRNVNDPESTDEVLLDYVNDFYSLEMCNDTKLFESFGTVTFTIDENGPNNDGDNTGVYNIDNIVADNNFINIVQQGFITLTSQADGSTSWNELELYQNPNRFFGRWGVNNTDVLTPGYPTDLLFYGNDFTFRTIPNTSYTVILYAYIKNDDLISTDSLPYDWWLRYVAYGGARQYCTDYRLSNETQANVQREFNRQKTLMLTRTHNQAKKSRGAPKF